MYLTHSTSNIIITAAKDREVIYDTLPTWLNQRALEAVVLVDWGSSKPIHIEHEKLLTVRVEENTWNLGKAFNLAAAVARQISPRANLFKLDADYMLLQDHYILQHTILPHVYSFYTGDWTWPGENKYLNGALVVPIREFFAVGGYNESLKAYGFDDTDLYRRLKVHRILDHHYIDPVSIKHIPHDDESRQALQEIIYPDNLSANRSNQVRASINQWNRRCKAYWMTAKNLRVRTTQGEQSLSSVYGLRWSPT